MHSRGKNGIVRQAAVLVVLVACVCTGCESEMAKEFREASGAELEQGVDYLMDGLVDGVFQVWSPDSSTSSSSSSTDSAD